MAPKSPFYAEYAVSDRSTCKKCKQKIELRSLRIAVIVPSRKFDGYFPAWHHWECFFKVKRQIHSTSQIANFDNLRWEDQEKIKSQIDKCLGNDVSNIGVSSAANLYFYVAYTPSSKSVCRLCEQNISKGQICIFKLDRVMQNNVNSTSCYHADCFIQKKEELSFFDSAQKLIGYSDLKKTDQELLENKFIFQVAQNFTNEGEFFKTKEEKPIDEQTQILEEQNRLFFDMRDKIQERLKKKWMQELLGHNKQYIPKEENKLLDHLADCLAFGALENCPECKSESLSFLRNKYVCNLYVNDWTKCQFETESPVRYEFQIPDYLQHLFTGYKPVLRRRLLAATCDILPTKHLPLDKVKIVLLGNLASPESEVRKQLEELGAKVQKTLSDKVNLCVISSRELDSNLSKIKKAQELNVTVVSDDFIKDIKEGSSVVQAVQKNLLSSGSDSPAKTFGLNLYQRKQKSEDLPKTATVTVKGAAAVDVKSGLQHRTQVYQTKEDVYSIALAHVDVSQGKNSFYKLQILQSNSGSEYYLFRHWGRIGTEIGDKKTEIFDDVEKAINAFKKLFSEKTGNRWWNRKNFEKYPGLMYPLELDYGQDNQEVQQKLKPGENSRLPKPVQDLLLLIFDEDVMTDTMIEFEIDLKKMPLGKVSEKQIAEAYGNLREAEQVLASGGNKSKINEVTNRFFTLIPHDFGLRKPPLLDNKSIIKSKIEMLDSLLQMEIAYNIIREDGEEEEDPIDNHYRNLKVDIETVEKDTDEYLLIETYLRNTHAPAHSRYDLDILEVFRVNRHGEYESYSKFKGLPNKKLLWHGSRLTNFVGILSQGLRIAPREAPCSGYMFGKGVYFADMVSKSANYSRASGSIGLLLLCEVALGNMYQTTTGEYIQKLPDGKHSTFGMGITIPDPAEKFYIGDVEVPYGKPVQRTDISYSQLQHNEYIVYNTNQINIKYLLKVNYKWNQH